MLAGADRDYGWVRLPLHIVSAGFSFSSRFSLGACPTDTCIIRLQRSGSVQDSEKPTVRIGSYSSRGETSGVSCSRKFRGRYQ